MNAFSATWCPETVYRAATHIETSSSCAKMASADMARINLSISDLKKGCEVVWNAWASRKDELYELRLHRFDTTLSTAGERRGSPGVNGSQEASSGQERSVLWWILSIQETYLRSREGLKNVDVCELVVDERENRDGGCNSTEFCDRSRCRSTRPVNVEKDRGYFDA